MIHINKTITKDQLEAILYQHESIALDDCVLQEIEKCFNFLQEFSQNKVIYGINTGFGPMAQYRVSDDHLTQLQYNIIRSHAAGAGEPLPDLCVKSAMIARLGTFLQCRSGVHPELVQLLVSFINHDIIPYIPEHGSVGASGDLVQLAHLALTLIGEGKVHYKGAWVPTAQVFEELGLKPFSIHLREGLSVTNGTSVMSGIAYTNIHNAHRLLRWSLLASIMMNEICQSQDDLMSEELNRCKRHEGQQQIAAWMRKVAADGHRLKKREDTLYDNGHSDTKIFTEKVQAYYSLRCIPQILGPILDTLRYTEQVVIDEFNSACDNPIVDHEAQNVFHGGNFHGDYISLEMDKLKLAMTRLTMLTERQMNYLFHDRINGILPPFVNLGTPGLNYGLQAAQFTACSTTAECQTLSNSMYVHSIPNNNDNQDIVSMGTNSANLCRWVINNAYQVMAIHFMALCQAVDCLKIDQQLCSKSQQMYQAVRQVFPPYVEDTVLYEPIAKVIELLQNKDIDF